ncbi:ATP-binding protein [Streptomyces sp. NPDC056512]|uniref:sensor histidine kinase n=1 Tax=Streptomyces sp. NPDC056512 TaxID=3345846 RepID=UPI0036B0084E
MTPEQKQDLAADVTPRVLTVRAWFLLALTVMGIVTLVAAGVAATVLARTTDATDRLVGTIAPARTDAFQLQAALLDQETGVRGYLLTGDKTLLEPYRRGVTAEDRSRDDLEALVADGTDGSAALNALESDVRTWREEFAVPAVKAKETNGKVVSLARGKKDFDQVRERLTALHAQLGKDQHEAQLRLEETRSQRDRAFFGVLVLLVLTGAGTTVLLRVTVVRPMEAVRSAARHVADGDFGHPIPARGPADLRALSQAVEAMRLRVVGELTTARHSEAALAEQATQMDAQAVELRRSNAELEQFAYVASHDLQEPLRKVASFCQLLERRYGEKLDERGLQYIAFAVDGAKRMQILINDLLTFSRVGRVNDAYGAVDQNAVFDRALRNLAAAVEEHDVRIERPDDLPAVMGDPMLLTMLWQNLLGNAIKFRAADRDPHITVEVTDDDEPGFLRFTVTDNGIGIAPEFAEKVFVIFQRLHSRDAYDGTGIGLSLCRKIVEHGGGRIWVDTSHTDGTRLVLTIPRVTATDADSSHTLTTEGIAS